VFVEFGVEDYTESNTRFLLVKDNWKGLVIDADADNVRSIRDSPLYWRQDLTAAQAFVTRDNVDEVLISQGFGGPVGLLSIDVDGNDYWIWEALRAADPDIVVIEYNSAFAAERAVVVPTTRVSSAHGRTTRTCTGGPRCGPSGCWHAGSDIASSPATVTATTPTSSRTPSGAPWQPSPPIRHTCGRASVNRATSRTACPTWAGTTASASSTT
jgi:hypothetical protein